VSTVSKFFCVAQWPEIKARVTKIFFCVNAQWDQVEEKWPKLFFKLRINYSQLN